MTTESMDNRAPLASQTQPTDKRLAGATEVFETPLEIRNLDGAVDDALRAWVHERLGRQLGKYATQIERVEVRFGDENGPKRGIDRNCMVHLILSSLAPLVVQMRAAEEREAFDLAAGRVERALRHAMQKHGFSTKHKRRQRRQHGHSDTDTIMAALDEAGMLAQGEEQPDQAQIDKSMYDRRVGRSQDQLLALQGSQRRASVDSASPGVSAEQRKKPSLHTATRNTKLHTDGMAYALEDSTNGKSSRKSTRAGKNRIQHDNGLTVRTKDAVHSPGRRAERGR
jgi:putative sigma-54 modulation protein